MNDETPPEAPRVAPILPGNRDSIGPLFADVSDKQAKLIAAIAAASKQFDRFGKSSKGSVAAGSSFQYADIAEINQAIRQAEGGLADKGVAVMQPLVPSPLGEGWTRINTTLAGHGAVIIYPYDLRLADLAKDARAPTMAQRMGAVITYMRRYLLQAALNLAGDKDLDALEPDDAKPAKQATPPAVAKPAVAKPAVARNRGRPPKQAPPRQVQTQGEIAKPEIAKPEIAKPATSPVAVVPEPPKDEPPHPADNQEEPLDFSLRSSDEKPGEVAPMTTAQKNEIKVLLKQAGLRTVPAINEFVNDAVPGATAASIKQNTEHGQTIIDALKAQAAG